MEFPGYKPIEEIQIATRSDKANVIAIASCQLGLIVRVESNPPSQGMLLDSLLNHTPPDSLSWNEENWAKVEHLNG